MLHFVSGLPRAGSTLLCNILAQRHGSIVTPTSPLPGILRSLRDNWRGWHRTQPDFDRDGSLIRSLRGIIEGYHTPPATGDALVIDKSRDWPALLETLELCLGRPPKIVCSVRPIHQVATSMELVWRRNVATGRVPANLANDPGMATTHARVQRWMGPGDVIGKAINTLSDAYARGGKENIHLVTYSRLTHDPGGAMQEVDDFLGLLRQDYDFKNVQQQTVEDDEWHGYSGLHDIRKEVKPNVDRSREILGADLAKKLEQMKYPWDVKGTAASS